MPMACFIFLAALRKTWRMIDRFPLRNIGKPMVSAVERFHFTRKSSINYYALFE